MTNNYTGLVERLLDPDYMEGHGISPVVAEQAAALLKEAEAALSEAKDWIDPFAREIHELIDPTLSKLKEATKK